MSMCFESISFEYGHAPLNYACIGGHVEVVTLLLTAGAEVDVEDAVSCCLNSC
jgi:ankyrin repeat protein